MSKIKSSPLFIIFTTVLIDLIGFGMIIPLVGLYGRHYGATGWQLSLLGSIYSLMQFVFAPLWGSLSDRIGRRPVLLISLMGLAFSYLIFGLAPSFFWLFIARAFGGIFAANISTAYAFIADVTLPKDRAKGMGLLGAAFGVGFTLGPPLGGLATSKIGLFAPGLIASALCTCNLVLAYFRLPESLPAHKRQQHRTRSLFPLHPTLLWETIHQGQLGFLLLTFFFVTFAFSNMEQTFSLLLQGKFHLTTEEAGYQTGLLLMASSILGIIIQGGLIRFLVRHWGERALLIIGLGFYTFSMLIFPYGPSYSLYFFLTLPLTIGSSLVNPSLSSLISQSATEQDQGSTLGLSQGLGSLARGLGPFFGLISFGIKPEFPYWCSSLICFVLFVLCLRILKKPIRHSSPAFTHVIEEQKNETS